MIFYYLEVKVENTEELNSEKEIGPQDKAAVHNLDVTLEKFTELRLQTSYRRSVN